MTMLVAHFFELGPATITKVKGGVVKIYSHRFVVYSSEVAPFKLSWSF